MSESYSESNKFIDARGLRFHYALDGDPANPVLALVNMASANLTTPEWMLQEAGDRRARRQPSWRRDRCQSVSVHTKNSAPSTSGPA